MHELRMPPTPINYGRSLALKTLLVLVLTLPAAPAQGGKVEDLIWAAFAGDLEKVKNLIQTDKVDVNAVSHDPEVDGMTALLMAVGGQCLPIRPENPNPTVVYPRNDTLDVIRYLLSKNADPNRRFPGDGWTPLTYLAANPYNIDEYYNNSPRCRREPVKALLEHNADWTQTGPTNTARDSYLPHFENFQPWLIGKRLTPKEWDKHRGGGVLGRIIDRHLAHRLQEALAGEDLEAAFAEAKRLSAQLTATEFFNVVNSLYGSYAHAWPTVRKVNVLHAISYVKNDLKGIINSHQLLAEKKQLVLRNAPIWLLHPDEKWAPKPLQLYREHDIKDVSVTDNGSAVNTVPYNDQRHHCWDCEYNKVKKQENQMPVELVLGEHSQTLFSPQAAPTYAFFLRKSEDEIWIFYFLFFGFNQFHGGASEIGKFFSAPGDHFGDIVHITTRLRKRAGNWLPVEYYYAAHGGGQAVTVGELEKSGLIVGGFRREGPGRLVARIGMDGAEAHPLVFLAKGTHETYPLPNDGVGALFERSHSFEETFVKLVGAETDRTAYGGLAILPSEGGGVGPFVGTYEPIYAWDMTSPSPGCQESLPFASGVPQGPLNYVKYSYLLSPPQQILPAGESDFCSMWSSRRGRQRWLPILDSGFHQVGGIDKGAGSRLGGSTATVPPVKIIQWAAKPCDGPPAEKWSESRKTQCLFCEGDVDCKLVESPVYSSKAFSDLSFTGSTSGLLAWYPIEDGRVYGEIAGEKLTGHWVQKKANQKCSSEKYGSFYWGRVALTLSGDRAAGEWSYCDKAGTAWEATRKPQR